MSKKLSVTLIANLKPDPSKRVEIPDAGCVGLYLSVTPRGSKTWVFRYRFGGKPKKLTIGPFLPARTAGNAPALGEAHTLSEARAAAVKAGQDVAQGVDPGAEKQALKLVKQDPDLQDRGKLKTIIRAYLQFKSNRRSVDHIRRYFEAELLPSLGERDVKSITHDEMAHLLEAIVLRGSPITANRVFANTRALFRWARKKRFIAESPLEGMDPPAGEETARERYLSESEIAYFWQATETIGDPFGPLFRLLLVTGQRRGEVAGMSMREIGREIDQDGSDKGPVWTIPSRRSKNKDGHRVPLSPLAVEIIESVPRIEGKAGLVFSTNGETPVSGFSKSLARLNAEVKRLALEADPNAEPEPFTLHDLRRTATTFMAKLRVPPHVCEAILNHRNGILSGLAKTYNLYQFDDEKRAALNAWASYLLDLTGEAPASNVVALKA